MVLYNKTKSTFMVDSDIYRRIRILAIDKNMEVSALIEESMREKLEREDPEYRKLQQPPLKDIFDKDTTEYTPTKDEVLKARDWARHRDKRASKSKSKSKSKPQSVVRIDVQDLQIQDLQNKTRDIFAKDTAMKNESTKAYENLDTGLQVNDTLRKIRDDSRSRPRVIGKDKGKRKTTAGLKPKAA
jgi:phage terminase small subunit